MQMTYEAHNKTSNQLVIIILIYNISQNILRVIGKWFTTIIADYDMYIYQKKLCITKATK